MNERDGQGTRSTLEEELALVGPQEQVDLLGEVGEVEIADDAVTRPKIRAGAVGTAEIGEGEVKPPNIEAGAVGTAALADNAVTAAKAGAGVVTAVDAVGNAIESLEWHGTAAQLAQITTRDPNTTYYVT